MIAGIPKDLPVEKTIEMLIRLQFAQSDMSEERIQELVKLAMDSKEVQESIKKDQEFMKENG